MTENKKETAELLITSAVKNRLDTHKLNPEESYNDVLSRMLDRLGH